MEIAVYGFILFGSLGNDIEASEIDFLLKRRLIVKGRKNGRCIRSTDECHNYGMSPAFSLNPNPGEERALSRAVKRYAEYTFMEERQRASLRPPRKSQTVIVGASSAAQPSLCTTPNPAPPNQRLWPRRPRDALGPWVWRVDPSQRLQSVPH